MTPSRLFSASSCQHWPHPLNTSHKTCCSALYTEHKPLGYSTTCKGLQGESIAPNNGTTMEESSSLVHLEKSAVAVGAAYVFPWGTALDRLSKKCLISNVYFFPPGCSRGQKERGRPVFLRSFGFWQQRINNTAPNVRF